MSRNSRNRTAGKIALALALAGTVIGGAYSTHAQDGGEQFIDIGETAPLPIEQAGNDVPMPPAIQNEVRTSPLSVQEKDGTNETRQVASEVAGINQRMALMTAQLAELELKLKLAKMQEEIRNVGKDKKEDQSDLSKLDQVSYQNNFNQFPIPQKPLAMPPIKNDEFAEGPTLVAVEGVDGDLRALVSETGRSVRKVRLGEKVGKWAVTNITMDSVTIKNGKDEKDLYIEYLSNQKTESGSSKTGESYGMNQQMNTGSMPFGQ